MSFPDSFVGIFSCWVKPNFGNLDVLRPLFKGSSEGNPSFFNLHIDSFGTNGDGTKAEFVITNGVSSFLITTTTSVDLDNDPTPGWRHILASWDFSGASFVGGIYINDVLSTNVDTFAGPYFLPWSTADVLQFLGTGTFGDFWNGCVAEYYLNTQEYLDFSIVSNRRKFITVGGGYVDLGANGQIPTGTSPSFFFVGDKTQFIINNGTRGTAGTVGTFLNCLTSPPLV